LQQLSALTRLEIVGERLGQLDAAAAASLGSLSGLLVLEIVGQEPWLLPELGVKEQLSWLRQLRQLRQLRLGGIMLGRSKLARDRGSTTVAAAAAAVSCNPGSAAGSGCRGGPGGAAGSKQSSKGGSSSTGGSNSSSSSSGHVQMPAVKGLGNGLTCSSSTVSATTNNNNTISHNVCSAAKLAAAALGSCNSVDSSIAVVPVLDPAAAAARDMAVSLCLEELRRWLCEMLPYCRVWLD
jgi:hypothetical protein